eukprot:Rmarinus@m.11809
MRHRWNQVPPLNLWYLLRKMPPQLLTRILRMPRLPIVAPLQMLQIRLLAHRPTQMLPITHRLKMPLPLHMKSLQTPQLLMEMLIQQILPAPLQLIFLPQRVHNVVDHRNNHNEWEQSGEKKVEEYHRCSLLCFACKLFMNMYTSCWFVIIIYSRSVFLRGCCFFSKTHRQTDTRCAHYP